MCVAGEDWESGTEKITRSDGIGFLRLAFLDLFNHFVDVRVGRTKARERGCVLLDEAEERDVWETGRDADFNDGFRLMLFWRIELREAGPQNMGLQIVPTGGDGTLLDLILN